MKVLLFLAFLPIFGQDRYAGNPIIKSIFTADPSAHAWGDGRLYLYPSHDIYPARGCDLMDKYHVYSTVDMVDWRDEGEIVGAEDCPWGRPEGGFMWAPDAAYKNGTYYYYFPHPSPGDWNSNWKIGVATSKYPNKDFVVGKYMEDLVKYPFIDPCVFTDDDGTSYIYIGGGDAAYGGKLGADMMSVPDGMELLHNGRDNNNDIPGFKPKYINGLDDFHEGSWVFKRNGLYYYMYADNNPNHNRQRYATATNPLGPFEQRGVVLGPNNCDTSHGSIAEFNGHWYIFYHNAELSGGAGNLRSVCADEITFNEDGTIKEVVQSTQGVAAIAKAEPPSASIKTYAASTAKLAGGATLNTAGAGSIENLHLTDAVVTFTVDGGAAAGRGQLVITYSLEGTEGTLKQEAMFKLTVSGKDYSYVNVFNTGGWNNFTGKAPITVNLKAGANDVVIAHGEAGANIQGISVELLDA